MSILKRNDGEVIAENDNKTITQLAEENTANLHDANLRGANFGCADLRGADLSQAKNVLSPADWIKENLETTEDGIIAYKSFGDNYDPPESWKIEKGSVLEEVVNPCRTVECACGVNVATLDWCEENSKGDIWKVLIPWEDAPGIVVPYGTDGKFRCERCKLIEIERESK